MAHIIGPGNVFFFPSSYNIDSCQVPGGRMLLTHNEEDHHTPLGRVEVLNGGDGIYG